MFGDLLLPNDLPDSKMMNSFCQDIKPGDLVIITNFVPEYNSERIGIVLGCCIPYKNDYKYAVLTDKGEELIEAAFLFSQEPCVQKL